MACAGLAQLVERKALNLVVVGSSPTAGGFLGIDRALPRVLERRCGFVRK